MSSARLDGLRFPDRFDIEQLMYRYAKAADQADIETQLTVFDEDCRVRFSGTEWLEGHDALRTAWKHAYTRYAQTSHAVTNISITFTGHGRRHGREPHHGLAPGLRGQGVDAPRPLRRHLVQGHGGLEDQGRARSSPPARSAATSRRLTRLQRFTMSDGH